MKTETTFQHTHWQLAPEDSGYSVMQGIDDIHQCIANILNTQKGSDVLRPTFGCDHWQYLDQPYDVAIPNIVREIWTALEQWETRIVIERIDVQGQAPQFECLIHWYVKESVSREIYQSNIKVSQYV